jgi:hypothetical protein
VYLIALGLCVAYIVYLVFGAPLPGEDIISTLPVPPNTTLLERAASLNFCDLVSARADYTSSQSLDDIIAFYRQHAYMNGWEANTISAPPNLARPYSDEWTQSARSIVAAWRIPGEEREYIRIGIVQGGSGDSDTVGAKTAYRLQVDYIQNTERCIPPGVRQRP